MLFILLLVFLITFVFVFILAVNILRRYVKSVNPKAFSTVVVRFPVVGPPAVTVITLKYIVNTLL